MTMVVATSIAFGVGFLFLARKSFFVEEAVSLFAAKLDLHDLSDLAMSSQANMSLYYLALHIWIRLLGESELAVRSLSLLAAVATVPVLYVLAKGLFGPTAAAFASVLLSVNAFFIYQAQEARGYSLLLLLVTMSSYCFVRATERSSNRWWVTYAVTSTLAVYTHVFGILVLLVHVLSLPLLGARRVPWKPFAVTLSGIALGISPMALFVLTRDVGQIDWVMPPIWKSLVGVFLALAGYGASLLVAYFLLCCLSLQPLLTGDSAVDVAVARWRAGFVLMWLFVPILLSFFFSLIVKPIFVEHYLIVSLPPLVLLAGLGVARLPSVWLRVGVAGFVIALASYSISTRIYGVQREDWRDVTNYVVANTLPGDAVVFEAPYGRVPFEYYLMRSGSAARAPQPAYPGAVSSSNALSEPEGPSLDHVLRTLETRSYQRVWLLLSRGETTLERSKESRSIRRSLERQYDEVQERAFDGVQVLLFERTPITAH